MLTHIESIRLNYFYKANSPFIVYRIGGAKYSFPVTSKRRMFI
jgi:hypothetical protein